MGCWGAGDLVGDDLCKFEVCVKLLQIVPACLSAGFGAGRVDIAQMLAVTAYKAVVWICWMVTCAVHPQ